MSRPTTSDELRRAYTDFFAARGHTEVPSASLIPVDKSLLFTVAGMVPFKSYFVGEETPPYPRAVSVQKCVRAGGKHNDLDDIGRTNRHFSFFEMLGNFSFGDYFKTEAIEWAWEFYTEVLHLEVDNLWVTVHEDDHEAASIWRDVVGFPADRIQPLGEDNFWRMADTGPCGPSSEIFWDLGPEHGPDGGPITEADRYIEIWNLVFMQFDQRANGDLLPLPKPSIDTGAGLERNLMAVQGTTSIFDIDIFRPLVAVAEEVTGVRYGGGDPERDVSLRILAEHARTMSFLVSDGVRPTNQERGYVLRRIIRRAVRHAYLLGAHGLVTPALIDATVQVMGNAYPELVANHDVVQKVVQREEESFRRTLQRGVEMLDELLDADDLTGDDAFFLHDTLGFPIDLTREIAAERGRNVDVDGYDANMREQRVRAKQAFVEAGKGASASFDTSIVADTGPTEFTGRDEYTSCATVLGVLRDGTRAERAEAGDTVEVVLDRTPFYAESGGQVGDTGTITASSGAVVEISDAKYGIPGVVVHEGRVQAGSIAEGNDVVAAIDGDRRDRIRRNHTATHVLHYALRNVLGSHVQQAGSLVAPDRLRFDFSHFEPVSPEQLTEIERIANELVISDTPVLHYETSKAEAESAGAIAFFGEKYGDVVRVLEAGPSVELCGGTHVHALGFIGPVKIISEGSIGSNLRRIEAVTGDGALDYIRDEELLLRRASELLRASPREVLEKVERLVEQVRSLQDELQAVKAKEAAAAAGNLADEAVDGVLVKRVDLSTNELRQLAAETVRKLGSGIVAFAGAVDGKAAVAVAVSKDVVERGASADAIARPAAQLLGGGGGKGADLVAGGGQKTDAVEDAVRALEEQAAAWKQ